MVPTADVYSWDPNSTYIREPPFFKDMSMDPPGPRSIKDAYCLLSFGDCVTTDHISPAGSIHKDSPAAKYLVGHSVKPRDFNSYGSRRGNYEVMMRGTFGNIRIVNKLLDGGPGPKTIHIPTREKLYVYDAAMVSSFAQNDWSWSFTVHNSHFHELVAGCFSCYKSFKNFLFVKKSSCATHVSSFCHTIDRGIRMMGKTQLYWRVLNMGLEVQGTGMQKALCCW